MRCFGPYPVYVVARGRPGTGISGLTGSRKRKPYSPPEGESEMGKGLSEESAAVFGFVVRWPTDELSREAGQLGE